MSLLPKIQRVRERASITSAYYSNRENP